jgi:hypothetical protein
MATQRDHEINQVFMEARDAFGDHKSTGFLITVTAEACKCSYGRVVDAIEAVGKADAALKGESHD